MDELQELTREYNNLMMENGKLRERVRQQEKVIQQLRSTLAMLNIDEVTKAEIGAYTRPQRGRPTTIDEQTRQRIRKLKENGLTVREIAKQEGVSVGTVSKLTI